MTSWSSWIGCCKRMDRGNMFLQPVVKCRGPTDKFLGLNNKLLGQLNEIRWAVN